MEFTVPKGYNPILSLRETETAIKDIKDRFESLLSKKLNLTRISAPLFLPKESGLNDDLNGVERPVSFEIKGDRRKFEIVQSLAKWKRFALARYGFNSGEGIYTDMNAIRRDEDTDNLHSVFVDQWDWELIIDRDQRNNDTLKSTVEKIYEILKMMENYINTKYNLGNNILPDSIYFITSEQLLNMYPKLNPKEREYSIAKEKGAVFIMQIGDKLSDGNVHDGRAPDYDDWSLNGDIVVYYPVLDIALELSSMGIRVDESALLGQLEKSGQMKRKELPFQKALLNGELPYTIGGGIGQSRLCMFFLKKAHVGEVQASAWPEEIKLDYENQGVYLL